MSGHFSTVILNAYGAARGGLARAEERLALFPEPAILIAHIRSAEQEAPQNMRASVQRRLRAENRDLVGKDVQGLVLKPF